MSVELPIFTKMVTFPFSANESLPGPVSVWNSYGSPNKFIKHPTKLKGDLRTS